MNEHTTGATNARTNTHNSATRIHEPRVTSLVSRVCHSLDDLFLAVAGRGLGVVAARDLRALLARVLARLLRTLVLAAALAGLVDYHRRLLLTTLLLRWRLLLLLTAALPLSAE